MPVSTHAWLAGCAVLYPLLLNQAMASPLPIVLLSVLKSGNLVANVMVGTTLFGKRYSILQLLSVVTVSVGLVLAALGSRDGTGSTQTDQFGLESAFAATCLALALISRALNAGLQEAACSSEKVASRHATKH